LENATSTHTPILFRRKPILVTAVQFNKAGDHPSVIADDKSPTGFLVFTLENTKSPFEVTPGDWIVTGIEGEVYACKDTIFRKTYEREDGAPV